MTTNGAGQLSFTTLTPTPINFLAVPSVPNFVATPILPIYNLVVVTALNENLTISNPIPTWVQGQDLIIRITTTLTAARTIALGPGYRQVGVVVPNSLPAGKTMYLGILYNSNISKWDIVGITIEF